MASAVMHLYVGNKIAKQWPGLDLPQFYLGCIVPDSPNVNSNVTKETRWAAHIRAATMDEWCNNNKDFYNQQFGGPLENSLLFGYIIHNITDAVFDHFYLPHIYAELARMDVQPTTNWGSRWEDCFRFDYEATTLPWWTQEVAPALTKARPVDINGIGCGIITEFRDETIALYGPRQIGQGNPKVIGIGMMDDLANKVAEVVSALDLKH